MVALNEVIASNKRIASTFPNGLIAVFVGGTSGVGEFTVKAFAKHTTKPRVYIVGRSQEAAARIITECKQLNPAGTFEFIESDISLLKNVDDVCRQIRGKETAINLLFQSQGTMGFKKGTALELVCVAHLLRKICRNSGRVTSWRRSFSVLSSTVHFKSSATYPKSEPSSPCC
jgi:NAD(P)-dependent dehydrogenase (short-subunit alcohol dehydrogenase family)